MYLMFLQFKYVYFIIIKLVERLLKEVVNVIGSVLSLGGVQH